MTFDEADVRRGTGGRFTEWKGTDPEVVLFDAATVQARVDAEEGLPEGFRYVVAGGEGAYTVLMYAPHDMPRSAYMDVERSRIGTKTFLPHIRAAANKLSQLPNVKWVQVVHEDPPVEVKLVQQGYWYRRSGRHVVDIKLTGPAGSFTAPVPSTRSQEAVEWLAQTGQYPVLEKVVGPAEAERLIRKHKSDSAPENDTPDTLF